MSTLAQPTDHSVAPPDVRRSNLGLALRHLRDHGRAAEAAQRPEARVLHRTRDAVRGRNAWVQAAVDARIHDVDGRDGRDEGLVRGRLGASGRELKS